MKQKIFRITTVPLSFKVLLKGQLNFMSNYFEVKAITSGPCKEIIEISDYEKVDVIKINMTRKITPVKDFIAIIKMMRVFIKEKPSIVHTHTPKAGMIGMIAAKLTGVPIRLHTIAGLPLMETKGLKRLILITVEKLIYSCCTKVYPNSYGLLEYIKSYISTSSKFKVIANGSSNGIDTEYFSPSTIPDNDQIQLKISLNIKESDFVYLFVGRIVNDKGINELVKSFQLINDKNSKLLIVGPYEDELDPLLPQTYNEIQVNPNIINVGFQKDVRPYYSISNVLVFPSYREGFPNVVMQAGSMKLPCIVSDINGCNEIIIKNNNGIIISPKSEIELKNAMILIKNNSNLRETLKGNARKMIITRYDKNVFQQALLEEYYRLLLEKNKV